MRKYRALYIGATQNVEDLLRSHTAQTMLANSEFLVMLNQAAADRAELTRLASSRRLWTTSPRTGSTA